MYEGSGAGRLYKGRGLPVEKPTLSRLFTGLIFLMGKLGDIDTLKHMYIVHLLIGRSM